MEIHDCIGGVVGVGVGVVGNEGVLLTCLGRTGFWCWTSFRYQVLVARVFFLQLLDLALGLTIVIAEHPDWYKEVPKEGEHEHEFESGRKLHVERLQADNEVMEIFVI